MAGLIELVFVVALLYWFWKSQVASLGKDQDQGKDSQVKKERGRP